MSKSIYLYAKNKYFFEEKYIILSYIYKNSQFLIIDYYKWLKCIIKLILRMIFISLKFNFYTKIRYVKCLIYLILDFK